MIYWPGHAPLLSNSPSIDTSHSGLVKVSGSRRRGAAFARRFLLRERELEHPDDHFVPLVVVDAGQAVMVSAVRGQHKLFGHVSVLNARDPHKFARCAIEGTDGAESGGPRIEASAEPSIDPSSDEPAGPVRFI